jgi:hypothetical protein
MRAVWQRAAREFTIETGKEPLIPMGAPLNYVSFASDCASVKHKNANKAFGAMLDTALPPQVQYYYFKPSLSRN